MGNSMVKSIITLVFFVCFGVAAAADLGVKNLQDNSPDQYTVVKGDTLWAISGRFLKEPWRWPEIWNMNRDQIKNPHLIYPGDLIVLDKTNGRPSLRLVKKHKLQETVKLSPTARSEDLSQKSIPSIPPSAIEPFLSQPLVADQEWLNSGPAIVATQEDRVVIGAGDSVYALGVPENESRFWQIFRPGKPLVDPLTKETLGYEAVYLGEAKIVKPGDSTTPTTLEVIKSNQEITVGDRLFPAPPASFTTYAPHAPDSQVQGRIISAYGGVAEAGQNAIVTLNKGARDGLEVGHVLAIHRDPESVKLRARSFYGNDASQKKPERDFKLPSERYGLVFVFRTFDKVSYALVMQTNRNVNVLDLVQNP